jgi:hypothetical protein
LKKLTTAAAAAEAISDRHVSKRNAEGSKPAKLQAVEKII